VLKKSNLDALTHEQEEKKRELEMFLLQKQLEEQKRKELIAQMAGGGKSYKKTVPLSQ
jgi:hypothetical protein